METGQEVGRQLLDKIRQAQAEGSPVVAITTMWRSEVSDDYRHMGGTQSPNHLELFKPAVKWNGRIPALF